MLFLPICRQLFLFYCMDFGMSVGFCFLAGSLSLSFFHMQYALSSFHLIRFIASSTTKITMKFFESFCFHINCNETHRIRKWQCKPHEKEMKKKKFSNRSDSRFKRKSHICLLMYAVLWCRRYSTLFHLRSSLWWMESN